MDFVGRGSQLQNHWACIDGWTFKWIGMTVSGRGPERLICMPMRDDVEVDTGGREVLLHSYWTNGRTGVYFPLSVLYKEESQSWRGSQSNKNKIEIEELRTKKYIWCIGKE